MIYFPFIRMGKSQKKEYFEQSATSPGPIYNYENNQIKSSSKGFKFNNEQKLKNKRNLMPGPGHYKVDKDNTNPKWTMGKRSESSTFIGRLGKLHDGNPAPNKYDVNKSFDGPKVIRGLISLLTY